MKQNEINLDNQNDFATHRKSLKSMLWLCIFGIIMLFSGLTSAYIIRSSGANWLKFQLPDMFFYSTFVIILSSGSIYMAQRGIKRGNVPSMIVFLSITFILGLIFSLLQFLGWKQLYSNGIVYGGKYSNPAGSFIYVFTAVHLLHLLGGLIALTITFIKGIRKKYSAQNYLGIELISIYWHFLGVLWIYLFLFLIFIH